MSLSPGLCASSVGEPLDSSQPNNEAMWTQEDGTNCVRGIMFRELEARLP